MRLWTLYVALPFFIGGFLLLGYSFQYKLNFAACAIGWVMAEFAILVTVRASFSDMLESADILLPTDRLRVRIPQQR